MKEFVVLGGGVSEEWFDTEADAMKEAELRIDDCRDCGEWSVEVDSIAVAKVVSVATADNRDGNYVDFHMKPAPESEAR